MKNTNLKIVILSGLSVLILGATAVSAGGSIKWTKNTVSVTKCVNTVNGVKITNFGRTYELTNGCRDAGYGKRFYILNCTANNKYQVKWTGPCPTCTDTDKEDYFTKGSVSSVNTNGLYQITNDKCTSQSLLSEATCGINGMVKNKSIWCEYGCANNACRMQPYPYTYVYPYFKVKMTKTVPADYHKITIRGR
ncbi:MAG: hypothetical protein WA057_04300 [Candidatus Magasanikiibacteriota bacterium]